HEQRWATVLRRLGPGYAILRTMPFDPSANWRRRVRDPRDGDAGRMKAVGFPDPRSRPDAKEGTRGIRDLHLLRPALVSQVSLLRGDEARRLHQLGSLQPHVAPDAVRRSDRGVLGA